MQSRKTHNPRKIIGKEKKLDTKEPLGRKSQIGDYLIRFIPRIIFLVIVLVAIQWLLSSYIRTEVDTFDAEANLFVEQLLYSPNGLSYTDPDTGQNYPGIVDFTRISNDGLDEGFVDYGDYNHIAAKIIIMDSDGRGLVEAFINEDGYKKWIVLQNFPGPGGARAIHRRLYVLLKEKNDVEIASLEKQLDVLKTPKMIYALQQQLDILKQADIENNPSEEYVKGYLDITVVMPNS